MRLANQRTDNSLWKKDRKKMNKLYRYESDGTRYLMLNALYVLSVSLTLCSSVTWIQWWRKFFSFNRNNYGIINGNQWMFNDIGITTGSNGNNSTNSFKKNKKEWSHWHATHDEQKWENFRIIAICKVSSAYNIQYSASILKWAGAKVDATKWEKRWIDNSIVQKNKSNKQLV